MKQEGFQLKFRGWLRACMVAQLLVHKATEDEGTSDDYAGRGPGGNVMVGCWIIKGEWIG